MSGFARKVERNKIKSAIKKQGEKRTLPLNKYRFKTKEEMLEEQSNRLVEEMAKSMTKH